MRSVGFISLQRISDVHRHGSKPPRTKERSWDEEELKRGRDVVCVREYAQNTWYICVKASPWNPVPHTMKTKYRTEKYPDL